ARTRLRVQDAARRPQAGTGLPQVRSGNMRARSVSRREFLQVGAIAMAGVDVMAGQRAAVPADVTSVKALVFDTFGTVVDWRTSVTREVQELAKRKGVTLDAAKFADAWRAAYAPSMNRV